MNASQIFKAAHTLTRATIVAGDCYRVNFGAALRIVRKLAAAGGNLWEKAGYARIYLDTRAAYGFEYTTYKTGNISTASVRGESISNGRASSLRTTLQSAKLWFDLTTGQFGSKGADFSDFIAAA